jgi:hypothetical protein
MEEIKYIVQYYNPTTGDGAGSYETFSREDAISDARFMSGHSKLEATVYAVRRIKLLTMSDGREVI